jgi:hypothetical protein
VAIGLGDLLASFRRHLRAPATAPRTIELYGQSVRYFNRWLTDHGHKPVLDELTRHAIGARSRLLAEPPWSVELFLKHCPRVPKST